MKSWNENLKKVAYLLIAISLVPVVWLLIVGSTSKRRVKKDWLERDLKTVESMVYEHVDPFWKNPKELFKDKIDLAKRSLKRMHRMDFYLLIEPIFALLEDHESYVHFGMPSYMPVFPFRVAVRGDRIFIRDSVDPDLKNGCEISKVNGAKSGDFLKWVGEYVGAESQAQWENRAEDFVFKLPSVQRKEYYRITACGKDIKVHVVPISKYNEYRSRYYGRIKPFEVSKMGNVSILKIRSFSMWGQDIQDFEDSVENLAESSKKILIDLRDNPGGDWRMVEVLVRHMLKEPASFRMKDVYGKSCGEKESEREVAVQPKSPVFKGDLYVLVNERTLDEAYDAALLLSKGATVLGETPGVGTFRFTHQEYKMLPSVGMYFTLSCAKSVYLNKLRLDQKIQESFSDYISRISGKKDMVLEKAIGVIR